MNGAAGFRHSHLCNMQLRWGKTAYLVKTLRRTANFKSSELGDLFVVRARNATRKRKKGGLRPPHSDNPKRLSGPKFVAGYESLVSILLDPGRT